MAEPELPQRLIGGIGRHVGPAVDDHPAEQIPAHMHRPGQPLGQQLSNRGLARRLDAGDEQDGAVRGGGQLDGAGPSVNAVA